MLTIYTKSFKKTYFIGIILSFVIIFMASLVIAIWPEFKNQTALFSELLKSDVYSAFLGQLQFFNFESFSGFLGMYLFIYLEMFLMFLGIFYGASLISREVEKNTLDTILSLPISRTRFISEKFLVYLTNTLMIPISVVFISFVASSSVNEELDLSSFIIASFSYWLLFFAIGALSLLMGAIFLESTKAYSMSGLFVLGMWIIERIGGLVPSLNAIQNLSLFHYMSASNTIKEGFLFDEAIIVVGSGLVFFVLALYIFNKKDLAVSA